MYRCARAAAAFVAMAALVFSAAAQLHRNFPPGTLRGTVVFGEGRQITLNGQATSLTPGSRIRNQGNMLVLVGALSGQRAVVNYTLDDNGAQVRDVWLLRADEAAISPWPRTLEEARTWTYDATTMTWTKP